MKKKKEETGRGTTSWGLVTAAGIVVLYIVATLIKDVFSWAGLSYSLGQGDGASLTWPEATAVATYVLLSEVCALGALVHNWYQGEWKMRWYQNVLLAHVTLGVWLCRGLRWAVVAICGCASWAWARLGVEELVAFVQNDLDDEFAIPDVAATETSETRAEKAN